MKYTLKELCKLGAKLEPYMSAIGVHVALGGSCMYRGESSKDMDVILYPHERVIDKRATVAELERMGFRGAAFTADATWLPDVWVAETSNGRRVDFFFMDRAPFGPDAPEAELPDNNLPPAFTFPNA